MRLDVVDLLTSKIEGQVEVSDGLFMQEVRDDILHRIMTWQLAKSRKGNHSTKGVADISGSTRKIYNQKGGGRARHGSNRAVQFRGGAVIFGPHTRDHSFDIPKKLRKIALKMALSKKYMDGAIVVLKDIVLDTHKTSSLYSKLISFRSNSILIVDAEVSSNIRLASSNLKRCDVLPVAGLNVLDILKKDKLILTLDALKSIEGMML